MTSKVRNCVRYLGPALLLSAFAAAAVGCGAANAGPAATGTEAVLTMPGAAHPASTDATRVTAPPPTEQPTLTPTLTPPAPVAAVVNGQYVFMADYQRRLADFEEALLAQGLDPESEEGRAQLEQLRADVLESLVDFVLIEQAATGLAVTLDDEELEALVDADIAAGGGSEAFRAWLDSTGQTRDDYREALRQAVVSQRVLEAIAGDVITEVEQVRLRHIVLATEEEALEVRGLLLGGAEFSAIALERSMDESTREDGGELGWFPRGLLAPEMESVAFGLEPGAIGDIVRLGGTYHVVQVVDRDAARPLSAEMQIEYRLAIFDAWLAEQRESAVIERYAEVAAP